MIRFLWIPVAGTVAALVAISIARQPREESVFPLPDPREAIRERFEQARRVEKEEADQEPEEPEEAVAPPRDAVPAGKHVLRLRADGGFDGEDDESYASVEEVLAKLAPEGVRPTILLYNESTKVTEEQLRAVAGQLEGRCDVRYTYER